MCDQCSYVYFDFGNICDVVIGTKIDLRDDKEVVGQLAAQGLSPVKREQGIKLASKIRVYKYLECSALTQRGLRQVGLVSVSVTEVGCEGG